MPAKKDHMGHGKGHTGGAKKSTPAHTKGGQHMKKMKAKYHAEKFHKDGGNGHGPALTEKKARAPVSARTKEVDIHLASKIAHEFASEISQFKTKLQSFSFEELDDAFKFVPPTFVAQHLPVEVSKFRTYYSKFAKGSKNEVTTFTKWYEWASYEAAKTDHIPKKRQSSKHEDAEVDVDVENIEGEKEETRTRRISQSRASLQQLVKEREHMRALLAMCLRHNSTKRKEGQHALINHLQSHLTEQTAAKTYASLKEEAHHSVAYAISRLVLGMVTDSFANVALYTQALHMVLKQTNLSPKVIISLMADELNLSSRMKAAEIRLGKKATAGEDDDGVDPDDITDPTKGERNQRIAAAIFASASLLTSTKGLSASDLASVLQFLSFCYVEHKGLRVFTANLMLLALKKNDSVALLNNETTWKWVEFAFFRFPKVEYFRPEAIQLLVFLMSQDTKPSTLPSHMAALAARDPLEPVMMEQLANALFRREQVTLVHPMIHPIWNDLLELITSRCAQGESLKQHLTTLVHTVIAPYRRGSADSPRKALFMKLVDLVGRLALQHQDEDDRLEVVKIASKTVGFGKQGTSTKPTTIAELRLMNLEALNEKVSSLIRQLKVTVDADPASTSTRAWTIRELKACLTVPFREGTEVPYVNAAVLAALQFGFFPARKSHDEINMNRAVYLFAETYSNTFGKAGSLCRPKATVEPSTIFANYLDAEEAKKTRFYTAVNFPKFRKARNKIVEALDSPTRSVLFYDARDIHVMLTLIFVMLSVDDQTNESALSFAANVVPDLVRFYKQGTVETIDLLYDVLMALVMRPSSPLHVMPLMTCIRRIATGLLYKFARYIKDRKTLDLVLAPLVEAFHTDDREVARTRENEEETKEVEAVETSSSSSSSKSATDSEEEDEEEEGEESDDEEDATEEADEEEALPQAAVDGNESDTESDSTELDDGEEESSGEEGEETEEAEELEELEAEEDQWAGTNGDGFEEEEAPTQRYLDSLQHLAGNIDLGFAYPNDSENKEKSDVVRSITIAARVGLGLRSPVVVQVFQVLLAVMRSEVKNEDPVVFEAARSSIQMLMMSKQRYFGKFLPAEQMFQILGDIQTYMRKVARFMISKDAAGTRHGSLIRKRLLQLKMLALSVFHYLCFLAHKNHGDEATRITFVEFYTSIFYGRGWETKAAQPQLKRDMYHYRHAFAWALLPAAIAKFESVKLIDGAQRVVAFNGVCFMVESILSRISGLPIALKEQASRTIRTFLSTQSLSQIYEMKYTALHTFFHLLKMIVEYNSKVQCDTEAISALVDEIIEKDELQVSGATIRVVGSIEKLLNKTPRVKETKAAVPVQVLYKQHEAKWRKEKSEFYRKKHIAQKKTTEALLAHRNDDPTDEERAKKRRRREDLKEQDRAERKILREQRNRDLTKEEKAERRKRMTMAKQERIAKNKERKNKLHEKRKASFEKWRAEKLEGE